MPLVQPPDIPMHIPPVHVSLVVHASPSSQLVPSATGTAMHEPSLGLHVPVAQGPSIAEQSTAVPAHVPLPQTSVVVQASPSSQLVPSPMGVAMQDPSVGSQLPVAQGPSIAEQSTAAPRHAPAVQESPDVQASPSSQLVPSPAVSARQEPSVGSQTPTWHTSSRAEQSTPMQRGEVPVSTVLSLVVPLSGTPVSKPPPESPVAPSTTPTRLPEAQATRVERVKTKRSAAAPERRIKAVPLDEDTR
jgi:hypothetical protein